MLINILIGLINPYYKLTRMFKVKGNLDVKNAGLIVERIPVEVEMTIKLLGVKPPVLQPVLPAPGYQFYLGVPTAAQAA